jgi:hypothetical protein
MPCRNAVSNGVFTCLFWCLLSPTKPLQTFVEIFVEKQERIRQRLRNPAGLPPGAQFLTGGAQFVSGEMRRKRKVLPKPTGTPQAANNQHPNRRNDETNPQCRPNIVPEFHDQQARGQDAAQAGYPHEKHQVRIMAAIPELAEGAVPKRIHATSILVFDYSSMRRRWPSPLVARGVLALRARPSAQLRSRLICSSIVLASGTVSPRAVRTCSVVTSSWP